jgi:RimJ/RimL family protein N-acetyltransferase
VELSDGVVTLRDWREDDAQAVFEACQDPHILRWMPVIPRPYTMDDALAFVRGEIGLGANQFAVTVDGAVVASIGLRTGEFLTGEIGYWCAPGARGQGVVPRAARVLCRYAFESLGLERLQLTADPENRASQRVAEKSVPSGGGPTLPHAPPRRPTPRLRDVLAAPGGVARGIRGAGSKWVSVPLRDASGSRLPTSHQFRPAAVRR